ncbi:hypothetical protein ACOM2C_18660 [Pseudarthrobacter sp. So.54]
MAVQDGAWRLAHRTGPRPHRGELILSYLPSTTEHFANDRLNALAPSRSAGASEVPEVLFVGVQNAGRSRMAAAPLTDDVVRATDGFDHHGPQLAAGLMNQPGVR